MRSASSGSGTVVSCLELGGGVGAAERDAGANQQGLGGVQRTVELRGDLGHGQVVEVAQSQRGAVVRAEQVQHLPGTQRVQLLATGR